MEIILIHIFEEIISVDNLLCAWKEFLRGKRGKKDVEEFSLHLMDNILELHAELASKIYKHSEYYFFKINDTKPRDIHKASVRDRLLHHAIYRKLYPFFDKKFVSDSFSCRDMKGTHRAMNRFRSFVFKESKNHTKTCFVLKCDIRKFFASIDHEFLMNILRKYIKDENVIWLLGRVISSFNSGKEGVGLPLGNLTSQLLSNVYLNEVDQFLKNKLKVKYYIRYADDFVVLSRDRIYLNSLIEKIQNFLTDKLKLSLHPDKVFIKTIASGVDFMGWVHFTDHRILRKTTRERMMKNFSEKNISSYFGLLRHGNSNKLIKNIFL